MLYLQSGCSYSENKHLTELGACLTFRVNAHSSTDPQKTQRRRARLTFRVKTQPDARGIRRRRRRKRGSSSIQRRSCACSRYPPCLIRCARHELALPLQVLLHFGHVRLLTLPRRRHRRRHRRRPILLPAGSLRTSTLVRTCPHRTRVSAKARTDARSIRRRSWLQRRAECWSLYSRGLAARPATSSPQGEP
jgi:hypothetical protein